MRQVCQQCGRGFYDMGQDLNCCPQCCENSGCMGCPRGEEENRMTDDQLEEAIGKIDYIVEHWSEAGTEKLAKELRNLLEGFRGCPRGKEKE